MPVLALAPLLPRFVPTPHCLDLMIFVVEPVKGAVRHFARAHVKAGLPVGVGPCGSRSLYGRASQPVV
jgi:hypothetical protein